MRLWTVHPKYLDAKGLVALWREGLLAQAVLRERTRGYRNHPQLQRFRGHRRPLAAIARYLGGVCDEAEARGYRFDRSKIGRARGSILIGETRGQLMYEWGHLRRKLRGRSPEWYRLVAGVRRPMAHGVFVVTGGAVRDWERVPAGSKRGTKTKAAGAKKAKRVP